MNTKLNGRYVRGADWRRRSAGWDQIQGMVKCGVLLTTSDILERPGWTYPLFKKLMRWTDKRCHTPDNPGGTRTKFFLLARVMQAERSPEFLNRPGAINRPSADSERHAVSSTRPGGVQQDAVHTGQQSTTC